MNFRMEQVLPHQAEALQALARRTFIDTFAADNTPENLNAYLEKAYNLEQISAELNDPGVEYWFAFHGETPVGFLMLQLDAPHPKLEGKCLEIQRIYATQEMLGAGVGQDLFRQALNRARALKAEWIWLGVWKRNLRAVRFYEKNGFQMIGEQIFPMGDDPQEDWVMSRRVALVTRMDWMRLEPYPEFFMYTRLELKLTPEQYAYLVLGHEPEDMDDKWFTYFEDGHLYLHRSWTGFLMYKVKLENEGGEYKATELMLNTDPAYRRGPFDLVESLKIAERVIQWQSNPSNFDYWR